jgi:hypothetical protein
MLRVRAYSQYTARRGSCGAYVNATVETAAATFRQYEKRKARAVVAGAAVAAAARRPPLSLKTGRGVNQPRRGV